MLSRDAIRKAMLAGHIEIDPIPPEHCFGPNSVDLHLGNEMMEIDTSTWPLWTDDGTGAKIRAIDIRRRLPIRDTPRRQDGRWVLHPGRLYLGCTRERTYCRGLVPAVVGRSSAGRYGLSVHQTAGLGDVGFNGRWTLELSVAGPLPLVVGPGDRIVQVVFHTLSETIGDIEAHGYSDRESHYQGQRGVRGPSPIVD